MKTEDYALDVGRASARHVSGIGAGLKPDLQLNIPAPEIKFLGLADYEPTWHAMREFTAGRTAETRDEIWLLQHPPTFTQGQAGLPEHLLNARNIPVVQIDRGGQITYHGPGQIVAYLLLDLRRWKINVRELVRLMEQSVIDILADYNITASGRVDAPGVYVGDAKIAALGLKIKHSCCYHGLSFNIDMDLTPYDFINPCGYRGLRVTQLKDFGVNVPFDELEVLLGRNLTSALQKHLAGSGMDEFLSQKTAPHPNPLPASGAREPDVPSPHAVGRAKRGAGWSAAEGEGKTPRRDPELEEKLKGYARELRASSSDAEQRIWHLLRDRHFFDYKFRRQHPVGNYILDFYCADAKLAIELDGGQHAENEKYDLQRTETLQLEGIQVLRFWNNDVLVNTEAVLTRISEMLLSQQHPSPSPRKRGEGTGFEGN